jgi:serine/threonine-protein kinase
MECSRCRFDLAPGSRYCPSCGSPTDVDGAVTQASPIKPAGAIWADRIGEARFIPGTMLASRYRIVSPIGRGGMGEVYRADDLRLGQAVALKFLPASVATDAARLARLHQEVRLARQVSHPNVCRVYDIGDTDGQAFLSMEYVDGEDLASLLRRIGRLPADKAIQVARQLCAGLAAAHDRGVLHRDLKPANILIDGRGHVRIADFGLAALADERRDARVIAGTPGYMAPEQLDGRGVTVRTDVYALGLILYEVFTGQAVLARNAVPVASRASDSSRPTRPSTIVPDIDPNVERVVLRCLEEDPAQRPASALTVAAALPGGDPLAAALAAGETPSPDMIAAAGEAGSLSPAVGLTCLAATVIGILSMGVMQPRTTLLALAGVDKEPAVLVERARTIARNLGYENRPVDEAYGYESNNAWLRYVRENDRSPSRWDALKTGRPSGVTFWYRQSNRSMASLKFAVFFGAGRVLPRDPEETQPGMLSVRLDPSGRLVRFFAASTQTDAAGTSSGAPDWSRVFAESALPMQQFSPAVPEVQLPSPVEMRAAWEGPNHERPELPLRVEAAAARGRVVFFDAFPARFGVDQEDAGSVPTRGGAIAGACLTLLTWVGAGLLARRNIRQGRVDHRGALRVSVFISATELLRDTIGAHHPGGFVAEIQLLQLLLAFTLYFGVQAWLMYIAIEPYLRRVWPDLLIGWSRILAGRFRDPLVGRDVLIGAGAGTMMAFVLQLANLASRWLGFPGTILGQIAIGFPIAQLPVSARQGLELVLLNSSMATSVILIFTVVLVLFRLLFRSRTAAVSALVVALAAAPLTVFVTPGTRGTEWVYLLVTAAFGAIVQMLVLVRFGVLSLMVAFFVSTLPSVVPVTFDWSAPYAETSWLIVGTILALAFYGLRTAVVTRSLAVAGFEPTTAPRT